MSSLPSPAFEPTKTSAQSIRVALYIPSQTRTGLKSHQGVTQTDLLNVVLNFFTFEFGGATRIRATGYYVHPDTRKTQDEDIDVVYAFTSPEMLTKHMGTIEELANDLAVRLDQTSVAFEIGGTMYFAAPTDRYRQVNSWLLPKLLDASLEMKRGWSRYVDIEPLVRKREADEKASPKKK